MAVIEITLGGKTIKTGDIPLRIYAEVEKQTGISWVELMYGPAANASAGVLLFQELAEFLGVECPELTPNQVIDMVNVIADEDPVPVSFTEGLPSVMPDGSPLLESEAQTA